MLLLLLGQSPVQPGACQDHVVKRIMLLHATFDLCSPPLLLLFSSSLPLPPFLPPLLLRPPLLLQFGVSPVRE